MQFKKLDVSSYIINFFAIFGKREFKGWGRKKTGRFALWCNKIFGGSLTLQEDGFIRSIGLGVDGSPSFSLVEDEIGIYYDATAPSRLENILNSYDFESDVVLMQSAREAITYLLENNISKYNNTPFEIPNQGWNNEGEKVLVIAQTAGDASLIYGMLDDYSTDDMINAAMSENPDAIVYLKIHPDVLSGKKKSDIDIDSARQKCIILEENVNPLSLLRHFNKVYTKTSQMGFEALLVGCKCVCFGMPFYAGWGATDDRSVCTRRIKKHNIDEIFAAAYILYTQYYNPYENKESDIFDTIDAIVKLRIKQNNKEVY